MAAARRGPIDVAIRGGTVVTEEGSELADVGISAGRIVQVGADVPRSIDVVDATGMLVFPGGVDMHVHFSPSPRRAESWVDDFAIGSRAAAAGGITTVGNVSYPSSGEDLVAAMGRLSREATASSLVDYVLHPVLHQVTDQHLAGINILAQDGYTSLKIFMISAGFDSQISSFLEAMSVAAKHSMVVMIHAEDAAINDFLADRVQQDTERPGLAYAASRPWTSEAAATARAIAMCHATGASTYIVHVASEAAVAEIRRARVAGLPLYAETRPVYLTFTDEVFASRSGGLFIGSPPIRGDADRHALWRALNDGDVDTCCSDHAPWTRAEKLAPRADVRGQLPGLPEVETLMPVLFSEGVLRRRLRVERFVAVTSTRAARIFGIYPQKGTIAVGSDADIVVWDPHLTRTVRAHDLHSRSDYSPYEGQLITGWPRHTLRRGQRIYDDGQMPASSAGGLQVKRLADHVKVATQ